MIRCPSCNERHPTLDRLEYQREHPWQLNPEMLRESTGLSDEKDTSKYGVVRHFLSPSDTVSDEKIGEAWDGAAEKWSIGYTEFGDLNRQYVIDPAIFRILREVEGKRILDAGCGNGYLCRLLSRKGAEMVGVDVSARSIGIAEEIEREEGVNIEYHVGSVCNLVMFDDNMFDAVVSNVVLQDLQDVDRAVKEFHRVLKLEGKLVFSIMHPCFSSSPVHGWVRKPLDSDRKEDRLYWKVDRYFDRSKEEWQYLDLHLFTASIDLSQTT